jgi:hypothetical protein
MDRNTYEALSHRAQWAFSNRRAALYSIFESYVQQKKDRREYDAADR